MLSIVITLIGKPNVGKSTLFNQLTKTNNALVSNHPNFTRDRKYGYLKFKKKNITIIDTAGINTFCNIKTEIEKKIINQTIIAINEANLIFFILNIHKEITYEDEETIKKLREKGKTIFLILNKIDKIKNYKYKLNEYYYLGIKYIIPISAKTKKGINILLKKYLNTWIESQYINTKSVEYEDVKKIIKISIIGKSNVGKSTLLNTLSNQNRVITCNIPETTRDSISIPIYFTGKKYIFIDTAGIKKNNNLESIQKLSNLQTLKSISQTHISLFVIDATQNISHQDLNILNIIINSGNSLVILINKSENLSLKDKKIIKEYLFSKNTLIKFIHIHFISALYHQGIEKIFQFIDESYIFSKKIMKTSQLTKIMNDAIHHHPPVLIKGKKIKFKYAHPGGYNPPIIVLHGNQISSISNIYKRYLINFFQKSLKLKGTPIKIILKKHINPYKK
ncbi:GTPase Der [Buchnera aphidicola (Phyllaphis fagi)]|uniref:ribosome biogenesis GTPase Der n=1 Tax=Buchnera aphidicola TaxID=9 RepID=UPI003464B940